LGPWKQLHGDVFRIPAFPQLLATLTGSGLQILYTFIVILFIAVLGLFNPSFPGGLVTIGIFVYVFSG
jgi:transmembrane 9 superfamily protein 2/4